MICLTRHVLNLFYFYFYFFLIFLYIQDDEFDLDDQNNFDYLKFYEH